MRDSRVKTADGNAHRATLRGCRIVVTGPAGRDDGIAEALRASGAETVHVPLIAFAPPQDTDVLNACLRRLPAYAWIVFTSRTAVSAVCEGLAALGLAAEPPAGVRIAAVGPTTAEALRARGWEPALMPSTYDAESLLAALLARHEAGPWLGARVLWPRAEGARDVIRSGLVARGAVVDAPIAYRTVPASGAAAPMARQRGAADAVVLASGSAARAMAALPGGASAWSAVPIVAIGPETARAARAAGFAPAAIAASATPAATVEAVRAALGRRESPPGSLALD